MEKRKLAKSVPLDRIVLDTSYGRALHNSFITRLVQTWDWDKVGTIYLSERADGTLACLDGWHRVTAAKMVIGEDDEFEEEDASLPSLIFFGLTRQEEARLFDSFNRERKPLTSAETFKARLTAGEETACAIRDVVSSVGMSLHLERGSGPFRGVIRCVVSLERVYRTSGADGLRKVIDVLHRAWGNETAVFRGHVVEGLASFLVRYANEARESRLVERLRTVGFSGIHQRAGQIAVAFSGGSKTPAFGRAILEAYNWRLSDKLGTWEERVLPTGKRKKVS